MERSCPVGKSLSHRALYSYLMQIIQSGAEPSLKYVSRMTALTAVCDLVQIHFLKTAVSSVCRLRV